MKNFDKEFRNHIHEDTRIPDKINQLFSNFESEVNMKENTRKKSNLVTFFRNVSVAACVFIVLGISGCTYAHINGVENLLSPLLYKLGINSKYEENATKFNDEVTKENITVKLLDGAIDDTLLIVGSKINIQNLQGSWIEINGEYRINDIQIKPINSTIDRLTDSEFVYYQVFDVNEIKIKDKEQVKISLDYTEIKEYNEIEDLNSAHIEYLKTYTNDWSFDKTISVKNLVDSNKYEYNDSKTYKIENNIEISISEFIESSYSNILKIKTNKTNYEGNYIEKYYKVLDEQRNEIASFSEEKKLYDHRIYDDRLVLSNIDRSSKIYIEVYMMTYENATFSKVIEIPVDLSKTKEKDKEVTYLKEYTTDNYKIKYNSNWNLIPKIDTSRVGPNSIYLGTLGLEIPSTTNSEYTSSIYVKVIDENTTIDDYASKIRKENTQSVSEYFEEKSSSEVALKNQKGYTIVSTTTDGEENYIKQDTFTAINGKVYRIVFFGSEKEYNNLQDELNEFIRNFEI